MVGIMSICTGFGHYWGRNGEFCVAVGPTTKTTGILYASLIGFNPSRLKGQRGWAPSRRISQSMWKSSACMVAILQQKRVRAKIVTLRVLVQHLGHYNTLRHSDILKGRKLGIPPYFPLVYWGLKLYSLSLSHFCWGRLDSSSLWEFGAIPTRTYHPSNSICRIMKTLYSQDTAKKTKSFPYVIWQHRKLTHSLRC